MFYHTERSCLPLFLFFLIVSPVQSQTVSESPVDSCETDNDCNDQNDCTIDRCKLIGVSEPPSTPVGDPASSSTSTSRTIQDPSLSITPICTHVLQDENLNGICDQVESPCPDGSASQSVTCVPAIGSEGVFKHNGVCYSYDGLNMEPIVTIDGAHAFNSFATSSTTSLIFYNGKTVYSIPLASTQLNQTDLEADIVDIATFTNGVIAVMKNQKMALIAFDKNGKAIAYSLPFNLVDPQRVSIWHQSDTEEATVILNKDGTIVVITYKEGSLQTTKTFPLGKTIRDRGTLFSPSDIEVFDDSLVVFNPGEKEAYIFSLIGSETDFASQIMTLKFNERVSGGGIAWGSDSLVMITEEGNIYLVAASSIENVSSGRQVDINLEPQYLIGSDPDLKTGGVLTTTYQVCPQTIDLGLKPETANEVDWSCPDGSNPKDAILVANEAADNTNQASAVGYDTASKNVVLNLKYFYGGSGFDTDEDGHLIFTDDFTSEQNLEEYRSGLYRVFKDTLALEEIPVKGLDNPNAVAVIKTPTSEKSLFQIGDILVADAMAGTIHLIKKTTDGSYEKQELASGFDTPQVVVYESLNDIVIAADSSGYLYALTFNNFTQQVTSTPFYYSSYFKSNEGGWSLENDSLLFTDYVNGYFGYLELSKAVEAYENLTNKTDIKSQSDPSFVHIFGHIKGNPRGIRYYNQKVYVTSYEEGVLLEIDELEFFNPEDSPLEVSTDKESPYYFASDELYGPFGIVGAKICADGQVVTPDPDDDYCIPSSASETNCDGIDDDCNGYVDENNVCDRRSDQPICGNGIVESGEECDFGDVTIPTCQNCQIVNVSMPCDYDSDCDDGDVCNGKEICLYIAVPSQAGDAGYVYSTQSYCSMEGGPLLCIDGDICTTDSCDPTAGCQYTDNSAAVSGCQDDDTEECGNGIKEGGEECDGTDGLTSDNQWCCEGCMIHEKLVCPDGQIIVKSSKYRTATTDIKDMDFLYGHTNHVDPYVCVQKPEKCQPADETCDGIDNDCDEEIDEGVINACGRCGGLSEVCNNETDDNCDGTIDEDCSCDCDDNLDNDCDGETDTEYSSPTEVTPEDDETVEEEAAAAEEEEYIPSCSAMAPTLSEAETAVDCHPSLDEINDYKLGKTSAVCGLEVYEYDETNETFFFVMADETVCTQSVEQIETGLEMKSGAGCSLNR